jgi:hypothetical protein
MKYIKVFRKRLKPIVIDHMLFLCTVDERKYDVVFRTYSGMYKTSFVEILFDWKETYYVNLYKPGVRERQIRYAMKNNWKPLKEKQIVRISGSSFIIDEYNNVI